MVQETELLHINPEAVDERTSPAKSSWLSGGQGLFLGIGFGVVLTIVATNLLASQQTPPPTTAPPVTESPVPGTSVTVAEVETRTINRTLTTIGTVEASERIEVGAQETGLKIEQVLVDEGDFVKKGQLMATLDRSLLEAQLAQGKAAVAEAEARLAELQAGPRSEEISQAQARLDQTKARLQQTQASKPRQIDEAAAQVNDAQSRLELAKGRNDMYQSLVNNGAVSQDQFNQAASEYRSAQANLSAAEQRLSQAKNTNNPEEAQLAASVREAEEQLKQLRAGSRQEVIDQAKARLASAKGQVQSVMARLKNTRVLAPVSGKIADKLTNVGDVISGSQELFIITEQGRLELLLEVRDFELPQISTGQSVKITPRDDTNLDNDAYFVLYGKVLEIDPVVEEGSRKAIVKVSLPSTESLQPGVFLKGEITTSSASGLTVPAKAVLPQTDGSGIVYQLEADNTVKAQPVELGEILPDERIEIKSGLSLSDRIVVKGAAYLKEGDLVEVISNKQ
ncbi:MAG: efflux RND transporter periplasmic adaptor subunit [Symploca sp. SIO2D2]|nr:efflux RND transporter periplasmic adaptor subunit [Symploca sp. SIO2D2]NER46831.1 efflux RND transporter periplasmic adaptor subunit [Symploca sp. SIO1A3]